MKNKDAYLALHSAAQTPIRRHVKIRSAATPYDPQFKEYFLRRQRHKKTILDKDPKEKPAIPYVSRKSRAGTRVGMNAGL